MRRTYKCPICGRFAKVISAPVNEDGKTLLISGKCKIHGNVEVSGLDFSQLRDMLK